jgi:hypothetical protein
MRFVVLMLCGCGTEFGLDGIEDADPPAATVTIVEQFVQAARPKVDLLVVIDDTASMAQEQERLAEGFAAVPQALAAAGVNWHLGVTTTTMGGEQAGLLVGSPYVLTQANVDLLEGRLAVGTDGSGAEAGLAAAATALSLATSTGLNAGFRRDDASLHLLFMSDADDTSEAWLGADPVATFLDVLASEAARTGLDATASGVVGDVPLGCSSADGNAAPGTRYHEVIAASDGVAGSICAPVFDEVLSSLAQHSIQFEDHFALEHQPEPGTLSVRIDGISSSEWALELDPPTIVFDGPPPAEALIEVRYVVVVAQ